MRNRLIAVTLVVLTGAAYSAQQPPMPEQSLIWYSAQQPPMPEQSLICRPDCEWDAWFACRRPLPGGDCAEGYLYVCEGCTCGSISNQYCYPSGF